MLHILVIILFIFGMLYESRAEIIFFDETTDFFSSSPEQTETTDKLFKNEPSLNVPCASCSTNAVLSPKPRELTVHNASHFEHNITIKLFNTARCQFSDESIDQLLETHQANPRWNVSVYISGTNKGFHHYAVKNQRIINANIPVIWDINNKIINQYNVVECPTYIIIKNGNTFKIAGQIELIDIIEGLL